MTRVRMVIEVVEEVTTVIIECSGEKHNDECCTEVQMQEKEATEYEPQTWSGEEGSESITTFQTELQNWVGSLRDNMMKVHVAEEKKRQTDGVQKCIHTCVHGHHECKSVTRKRLYQVAVSRTKREAKSDVATLRSRFKETNGRHFDPRRALVGLCFEPLFPPQKNVSLSPPPPKCL